MTGWVVRSCAEAVAEFHEVTLPRFYGAAFAFQR
jgi:hypothetical protein